MKTEVAKIDPAMPVASSETTAVLSVIERIAQNPDADIEKLERMLDMQERILNRNAMVAFNSAMAEMQSDIPTIEKSGAIVVNGQERSRYARFEDIMRRVKPIMQRYGFAVSFRTATDAQAVTVTGVLMHREGHREETSMSLPVDGSGSKNSVQAIGSSTSYAKRYVLCALLNIATGDEDDDGQMAAFGELASGIADLEAAADFEELKSVFGRLWSSFPDSGDRKRLNEEYTRRKKEFM